jgi:hypothetical protein
VTRVEWPEGSGRFADYTDAEVEFMHGFRRQRDAGEITHEEMINQINAFHDLKVEFGVDIVAIDAVPDTQAKAHDASVFPDPSRAAGQQPVSADDSSREARVVTGAIINIEAPLDAIETVWAAPFDSDFGVELRLAGGTRVWCDRAWLEELLLELRRGTEFTDHLTVDAFLLCSQPARDALARRIARELDPDGWLASRFS